jgi:hypothetical protein
MLSVLLMHDSMRLLKQKLPFVSFAHVQRVSAAAAASSGNAMHSHMHHMQTPILHAAAAVHKALAAVLFSSKLPTFPHPSKRDQRFHRRRAVLIFTIPYIQHKGSTRYHMLKQCMHTDVLLLYCVSATIFYCVAFCNAHLLDFGDFLFGFWRSDAFGQFKPIRNTNPSKMEALLTSAWPHT